MSAKAFFGALGEVFQKIQDTQWDHIHTAATWVADSIMADRYAVTFGSGHSFIPTMDVYPRIGSFPGWLPLHELSTSYITRISGDTGLRQALFLEKVEGFGKVVMANYALEAQDMIILISNSGANTMAVEIALEAKRIGMKSVAITSVEHAKASSSYHKSGKLLYQAVDLVIDNCVPQGDALVEIPGFPAKVAAASTIADCIVIQAIAAEAASILSEHKYFPPVFPSHNNKLGEEESKKIEEMVDRFYAEDARRIKKVVR